MGASDDKWPKMGRPPKKIDWKKFEKMCARQCTKVEIALYFNMDPTSLEDKLKAKYGQTFSAVFKVFRMAGVGSLRNLQFEMAMKGDKQMIMHCDRKYAHADENVDPRYYGGALEDGQNKDNKIDINVSFTDVPDKCVAELAKVSEIENIKDEG